MSKNKWIIKIEFLPTDIFKQPFSSKDQRKPLPVVKDVDEKKKTDVGLGAEIPVAKKPDIYQGSVSKQSERATDQTTVKQNGDVAEVTGRLELPQPVIREVDSSKQQEGSKETKIQVSIREQESASSIRTSKDVMDLLKDDEEESSISEASVAETGPRKQRRYVQRCNEI